MHQNADLGAGDRLAFFIDDATLDAKSFLSTERGEAEADQADPLQQVHSHFYSIADELRLSTSSAPGDQAFSSSAELDVHGHPLG